MTTPGKDWSRRAALGLIGGTLLLPAAAIGGGAARTLSGRAFGTDWRITAPPGVGIAQFAPALDALFAGIDAQLSPWRTDSAVSRFNAAPAGAATADPALTEVTAAALDIARRSGGAFEPTIGPLVARWGFGPIARGGAPDWRALSVGPHGVTKSRGDLTLDPCGIAKGWALDRAAELLREAGMTDLLFDLGGEFVAVGQHPEARDWRVAVEAPIPGLPAPAALRLPTGTAVATSGTIAQSYVLGQRRYGHIIDPGTRAPATGALRSVTVVATDAMTADGWATALFAAGDTAGPDIARTHDIDALFLFEDDGRLREMRSGAISALIL
ncbi:FAD:protein FMN transferase [Roseivivax sediminis]|uniref:FAD:protein FMN transferase n=1 Tax=Roseivivax sediminis TaxID=936889 RepID=A0A1I1VA62_9RHOB|nr:FAD:protein FMN transferase [Roseivivax sediminis]SFD79981.1 thiamine biosynthesis lipoprotein [Roseivivax sediminis]